MSLSISDKIAFGSELDFSLGNAGASQESINAAVEDFISIFAPCYIRRMNDPRDDFSDLSFFNRKVVGTSLSFLFHPENEESYFAEISSKISFFNSIRPLDALIIRLNKMITALGFLCTDVEIRFEKGSCHSLVPFWHVDGSAFKHAIAINYSNRTNWSTRILPENLEFETTSLFSSCDLDSTVLKSFEESSQAAKFGYFYDAQKICHRGPRPEDINEPIKPTDYRLFMRFTA